MHEIVRIRAQARYLLLFPPPKNGTGEDRGAGLLSHHVPDHRDPDGDEAAGEGAVPEDDEGRVGVSGGRDDGRRQAQLPDPRPARLSNRVYAAHPGQGFAPDQVLRVVQH